MRIKGWIKINMPKVNTKKVFKEKIKTQYLVHKLVILWGSREFCSTKSPIIEAIQPWTGILQNNIAMSEIGNGHWN